MTDKRTTTYFATDAKTGRIVGRGRTPGLAKGAAKRAGWWGAIVRVRVVDGRIEHTVGFDHWVETWGVRGCSPDVAAVTALVVSGDVS